MKWFAECWMQKSRMTNDEWTRSRTCEPGPAIRHSLFVMLVLYVLLTLSTHAASRVVRVEGMTVAPGATNRVRVVLESLGNEKGLGFNLGYNPAVLRFVSATAGVDALAVGANLVSNPNQTTNFGRLAVALALDFSTPDTFPAGTNYIADVFFTPASGVTGGVSAITFTNEPGVTEISDPNVNELPATYAGSSVSVVLQCGFSLGSGVANFSDTGGGSSVSLTASNTVCAWSLVNANPWISVTSATNGTGSATVNFLVDANPNLISRTGLVVIAGQNFTVTQSGLTCTYALAPGGGTHGATAETNSFNVLAANPCAWSVVNTNGWVTILSGSSGSGNGVVTYAVADNFSATPRAGTLTVAGQTFSITQSAFACAFALSSASAVHSAVATTNSFSLTASNFCAWSVVNTNPWVTILSGGSGAGDGVITYSLLANPALLERAGALSIAGEIFTITQQGQPCSYALTPTNVVHSSAGGTGTVSLATGASCAWNVATTNEWIQLTSPTNGTGAGGFDYSLLANWSLTARTGAVLVAGQTLLVTQQAYAGGFVFSSINANVPGEISLVLTGGPLGVWSLEISGDLANWSSFASLTNTTGRVDFVTPVAASNRFYRAVQP